MKNSKRVWAIATTLLYSATAASGYSFNQIVPDLRQSPSLSGGSACPVRSHILTSPPATRTVQWSTAHENNPTAIIPQDQGAAGRLSEIEQVIIQSLNAWRGISGTTLQPLSTQLT